MKIYDRVHQLRIQFNVTPETVRCVHAYIIIGKGGCYLIDTEVEGYDKRIGEYVREFGKNRENINAVLLTHSHPDHIRALESIKEKYFCCVYAGREERDWIKGVGL